MAAWSKTNGVPGQTKGDGTLIRSFSQSEIDEIVAMSVPGPTRVLTKAEIAREYGEKATRPIPKGYKPRKTVAERKQLQKSRDWAVYRVFDNGRKEFMSAWTTEQEAIDEAGIKRDAMTDEECGKDFTYLAGRQGRRQKWEREHGR